MIELTERERFAYLAGIIDGEGCIGAWNRRSKNSNRPRHAEVSIRVCMTTPFAVKLLHETFGGSLFAEKSRTGKRQTFAWVVVSRKAEACLRALMPFLREKHEQAEVALSLIDMRSRRWVGRGHQLTDAEIAERALVVQHLKELKRQEYAATALQ